MPLRHKALLQDLMVERRFLTTGLLGCTVVPGPCAWPSFRCAASEDALFMRPVVGYGSYRCAVAELYCAKCHLFVGHRFQDAREKGDQAIECTGWRH